MTGFLAELGKNLADRWLSLLILPGALLIAAAAAAGTLGQAHAIDLTLLRARITAIAATPSAHSPGALLLAVGGILAASALAGLTAAALGSVTTRVWTAPGAAGRGGTGQPVRWSRPATWIWRCDPAYWLTVLRARSWRKRDDRWRAAQLVAEPLLRQAALVEAGIGTTAPAGDQSPGSAPAVGASSSPGDPLSSGETLAAARSARHAADAALDRRNRIAQTEPSRPTWISNRFHDAEEHIARTYHLDIAAAWPRLWAVLPDNLRADLQAAYDGYTASARLVGWALLYAVIGAWWWPSAVIAAVAMAAGWRRGRTGTAVLADLIEATVDLHGRTLAVQLGLTCDGPLDRDTGYRITQRLRRDPG